MHRGFLAKAWLQRQDRNHSSYVKINVKCPICKVETIIPVLPASRMGAKIKVIHVRGRRQTGGEGVVQGALLWLGL